MFDRMQQITLGAVLAATLSVPLTADAGPPSVGGDSPTVNLLDLYYDYQVWTAHNVTVYYVVATDTFGNPTKERFLSYDDAWAWAEWLFYHGYVNVTIEEHVEMGDWSLFGTWDTRTEAEGWEAYALSLGCYTKIVPISAFSSQRILQSPTSAETTSSRE